VIDAITQKWIRNAADQAAAENGCRFDEQRAAHVCEFFPRFLRLYEGEHAGEPFNLMPWQVDLLSRLFGWVRSSEFFKRDVRRFRKASIWLPKKSGKSPLAAGVGLYLLLADGEQGQKVFSAARDGKQATVVHQHARKMVESSPELSRKCKVNASTGRITHIATSSFYDLLSGDNHQGQEGLNGSVIIDETHVVDSRLASVVEHMGASRAEPVQFEVSTAGNNPMSYGRRQYEYGRGVNNGDFTDEGFFYVAYEAPQDATDEQLGDPAVWQVANPSWGHTINGEEFRDAFNRAKRSLTDWTTFKMYRLNVWANSANPFIKAADWEKCREEFTETDLLGQSCIMGLDLARKQDITAAVLLFGPDDEGVYRVVPRFWLPENRAKELEAEVPFLQWQRAGHVRLTSGDVTDYAVVLADILELAERFTIKSVVFDPLFAEELTQGLANEGIERVEFGQKLINFARPTAEFESLIIAGNLRHNGNPLLTWQVGNVMVKEAGGLMRPIRPLRGDHRTVDGVVAAIMALSMTNAAPEENTEPQLIVWTHSGW